MGVTRASIKDVAAMAGVSHQTVSRVINRPDLVAPPTRARVERAIRALGGRASKIPIIAMWGCSWDPTPPPWP